MNSNPFTAIARFYDRRVSEFGHHPRACDYGRVESQQRKFRVMAEAMDYCGRSVLDVGCGFADFASFLNAEQGGVAYRGIDLSPEMIARARAAHPTLDLRVGNILEEPANAAYDIVTANGIFYLLGAEAPSLMRQLVEAMVRRARRCVAFNSLSTWASVHEAGEFYADPQWVIGWCRELCPRVVLRHDYLPHDFTVYLYPEARS